MDEQSNRQKEVRNNQGNTKVRGGGAQNFLQSQLVN